MSEMKIKNHLFWFKSQQTLFSLFWMTHWLQFDWMCEGVIWRDCVFGPGEEINERAHLDKQEKKSHWASAGGRKPDFFFLALNDRNSLGGVKRTSALAINACARKPEREDELRQSFCENLRRPRVHRRENVHLTRRWMNLIGALKSRLTVQTRCVDSASAAAEARTCPVVSVHTCCLWSLHTCVCAKPQRRFVLCAFSVCVSVAALLIPGRRDFLISTGLRWNKGLIIGNTALK